MPYNLKLKKFCALDAHQVTALDHLNDNPRAALFLEMSLAKTLCTLIYLYDMLYKECAFTKVLIIAPDKVARITWPDEIATWRQVSDMRYSVVQGTAAQRSKALAADAEVFIIGVDNVQWLHDQYLQKKSGRWRGALPFDCVVMDELSLFKNSSSNRFKALRRAIAPVPYRIGLTGTPAANGLIDLWAQMFLIDDGERLGRTKGGFVDKYFKTRGQGMIVYEYKPLPGAMRAISKKIEDIVLSMHTRDHIELPPMYVDDIELSLPAFDREVYDELEREYILELCEGGDVTVKTEADLTRKLQQVTSGAIYSDKVAGEVRRWFELNDVKLRALCGLIRAHPDESIIVVYDFIHEVERIQRALPQAHLLRKGKAAAEDVRLWNEGKIKLLLLHPASAGHGLNLQWGGRRMVWFTVTWNAEYWAQTVARILRRGQVRDVWVHRLIIKGTKDVRVRARLEAKTGLQKMLMDEVKQLKLKYYGLKQR